MAIRIEPIVMIFVSLITVTKAFEIPAEKSEVDNWFKDIIKPIASRKGEVDPNLEVAEDKPKIIKVKKDGSGDFKSITDAIKSVVPGNSDRIILSIGGGVYNEKIWIERTKPFITLLGDPKDMPTLTFNGVASKYGTEDSASLIVDSDYFMAANLIIENSSPRPGFNQPNAQGVAMRISGDKAAFYNCQFLGFQDTLCDDRGFHFYKDCYVEGTVDFIFGAGTSIYLNTHLNCLGDEGFSFITAQDRESKNEDTGFSFVHCTINGTGSGTFLGRPWRTSPRVVFAYTEMSEVVKPEGWTNNFHVEREKTSEFSEYKNIGTGADKVKRVNFVKQLTDEEAKPFLSLTFIVASKWLLPPPQY